MAPDPSAPPYSAPLTVASLADCRFYHTMQLPGVGPVSGPWDLRHGVDEYLGHESFAGKRVLEVGTASGFLCFEMEHRGAEVVAYDLADQPSGWDIVPFGGTPDRSLVEERAAGMRLINNAFWFAHNALGSRARVVYGSVYDLPPEIGLVDTAVFGAVLLHVRDPFLALQRALVLTRESVIVTEPASLGGRSLGRLPHWLSLRLVRGGSLPGGLRFLPDPRTQQPFETWWKLTPWAVGRMLQVLGFEPSRLVFHTQLFDGKPCPMYTVVGRRDPRAS